MAKSAIVGLALLLGGCAGSTCGQAFVDTLIGATLSAATGLPIGGLADTGATYDCATSTEE